MARFKRILNELNKKIPEKLELLELDNKFQFAQLDYDIVPSKIGIINNKTNNIELEIIIPTDYPFKSPNVLVQKHIQNFGGYSKWLSTIIYRKNCDLFTAWIFSIIRRPKLSIYWKAVPNKNTCLCCESICCSNNWSPGHSMCDILAEYVIYRDFNINTGALMQRWIAPIFNNDRWCLPDDIILLIIKNLTSNLPPDLKYLLESS